jgi:hypothetical protein
VEKLFVHSIFVRQQRRQELWNAIENVTPTSSIHKSDHSIDLVCLKKKNDDERESCKQPTILPKSQTKFAFSRTVSTINGLVAGQRHE